MAGRKIMMPGPDHPITIAPNRNRIIVTVAGNVIADTTDALTLREASYPAVWYVPRKDVDIAALVRSATTSWCPYKGEASYFSVVGGGERAIDAIWSYETPHQAVAAIGGYLAFYRDRVDTIEERAA